MSFAIIPSEEISHRCDFSILANARGYLDAVEVGVDMGVFAADFLRRFRGNWLVGVDPYSSYEEMRYDRSGDMAIAVQALAPYHGRFRLVRAPSPDAVPFVLTFISPDFVYIDGSHKEADVRADMEAWWAALPEDRGMLAGHDWDEAHPGVRAAVEAFARERDLAVYLTRETTAPASWYCYRAEPAQLIHKFFRDGGSENPRAAKA